MIDTKQALLDLAAMPGDLIAVPKLEMASLLTELADRQARSAPQMLSIFAVAAIGTSAAA